jgi:hypothetical protein
MRSLRFAGLAATVLFAVSPIAQATAFTYTIIDVPGSTGTEAWSVNDSGEVVGQYSNSNGGAGFLYDAGTYTTLDAPGSSVTYPVAINDSGEMIGVDDSGAFLYDAGTYTTLDPPGSVGDAEPLAINANGEVVGYYGINGPGSGFVYDAGAYSIIDVPGSYETLPSGINNLGQVVGNYNPIFPPGYGENFGFVATPVPSVSVPEPPRSRSSALAY